MTLTEVVVVTLLLAVLVAAGWSGWGWFMDRAETQNSQFTLRQLATSLQQYEQSRGYFPDSPAELERIEPALGYTLSSSNGVDEVAVAIDVTGERLGLAIFERGKCTTITVVPFAGGQAETTGRFEPSPSQPCDGQAALAQEGKQW